MTRPLIGVTTSRRGGWKSYLLHRLALARSGARSVRLLAGRPLPGEPLDGLVIGGGDDIGAELYGGKVLPDVRIDPERDKLELQLLETLLPRGLPILGICRGSQMINVALGGTLHTDIQPSTLRRRACARCSPGRPFTSSTAAGSTISCAATRAG